MIHKTRAFIQNLKEIGQNCKLWTVSETQSAQIVCHHFQKELATAKTATR